jgi:drug/metabolite transporter (DMT)-like permease
MVFKLNSGLLQIALLVLLLAAMNIGIKQLTNNGITGAEILLLRSICNLLAAFAIAAYTKKSIIPQKPTLQLGAFICLGLSLLLIFTAYQYISAGSVSTLQRLDIPLLVLIAAFNSKSSWAQILISSISLILVAAMLFLSKTTDEKPIGYFIVLVAVVIICINTLLQKKIAVTENIQTIIFISSLSSVFWGAIRCWQTHSTFANIHLYGLVVIIGLSFINLIIFYIVNDLYKKHNPEVVRYPYLLAAFFTMIVEMVVAEKLSSPVLIIGNTAILIVLTILVRSRQSKKLKEI